MDVKLLNNKPDFGESKPKDHDILATVPAVPGIPKIGGIQVLESFWAMDAAKTT